MNSLTNTGLIEVGNIVVKLRRSLLSEREGEREGGGERERERERITKSQTKLI